MWVGGGLGDWLGGSIFIWPDAKATADMFGSRPRNRDSARLSRTAVLLGREAVSSSHARRDWQPFYCQPGFLCGWGAVLG